MREYLRRKIQAVKTPNKNKVSKHRLTFKNDISINQVMELYKSQCGRCAVTGIAMTNSLGMESRVCMTNASIDRLDVSLPYTISNIRLVCIAVNYMRNQMHDNEMYWWCEQILKHANKPAQPKQTDQLTLFDMENTQAAMDEQAQLFDYEKKKRKPRRVMLHVIDAGQGECDGGSHMVRMACSKCGHETEWFEVKSTTEGKKGKACPQCNVQTHSDEA